MSPEQISEIAEYLREIPLDSLQRASLKYAAMRLRATGEANTEDAALLLEQMAIDSYDQEILT